MELGPRRRRDGDWTHQEVRRLREGIAAGVPVREIHLSGAFRPHRTLSAVRAKAHALGLTLRRHDEEFPPGSGWPVQFRCPRSMHRWINQRASSLRTTPAAVVREAVSGAMRASR